MKLISNLAQVFKPPEETKPILCEYVMTPVGDIKSPTPFLSTERVCEWCGGRNHYCPFKGEGFGSARAWLCSNINCSVYKATKLPKSSKDIPKPQRSIEWPLFCEINGVGDRRYDVKFENIEQSAEKINYLLKYAESPNEIVIMKGQPGRGKTYAALALCELFTRTNKSVIFTTQKKMSDDWLFALKGHRSDDYINSLKVVNLLVVDDFGTAEVGPGFMNFFMDIINHRMQWNNRGTVITTNLEKDKLSEVCGEALVDRFRTGQVMNFTGPSRREKKEI